MLYVISFSDKKFRIKYRDMKYELCYSVINIQVYKVYEIQLTVST